MRARSYLDSGGAFLEVKTRGARSATPGLRDATRRAQCPDRSTVVPVKFSVLELVLIVAP